MYPTLWAEMLLKIIRGRGYFKPPREFLTILNVKLLFQTNYISFLPELKKKKKKKRRGALIRRGRFRRSAGERGEEAMPSANHHQLYLTTWMKLQEKGTASWSQTRSPGGEERGVRREGGNWKQGNHLLWPLAQKCQVFSLALHIS